MAPGIVERGFSQGYTGLSDKLGTRYYRIYEYSDPVWSTTIHASGIPLDYILDRVAVLTGYTS